MYILVDIGGTKMRVATTVDLERFERPQIFHTPGKYHQGIQTLIDAINTASEGATITRIMVGMPGVVAEDHRSLITNGNIPDWKEKPVAADLEKAFGGRVHIENDTALCGLGEAVSGAGKGARVVMYLTVSTGAGGVRIVDGVIDLPDRSAEIGYQYLTIEEPLQRFADLVSGRSISKRFGMAPRDLGKDHEVWEELARYVAIGVHNSILHWTPDRVVLGGSMFNEIGIPVDRVAFYVKEIMRGLPLVPEIVHSSLGDVGGLWGGLARLRQLQ